VVGIIYFINKKKIIGSRDINYRRVIFFLKKRIGININPELISLLWNFSKN